MTHVARLSFVDELLSRKALECEATLAYSLNVVVVHHFDFMLEERGNAGGVPHRRSHSTVRVCGKLTEIDRDAGILSDDWEYRLPTETEWEYACRAGTSDATYDPLDSIAWHFGNSDLRTHPVCEKSPNPWGFYGMLGNVWEMRQDWSWVKRQHRACRRGSYFNTQKCCRAAARANDMGGRYCGFRLAAAPVGPCDFCPSIEAK